jgi:hypothetical protein
MDKMVSNSLSDSSPNGFHATALNDALGSAQVGRGIILDGTDDYVNLGREAGNPGSVVGTSFWVKSSVHATAFFPIRKRSVEPQAGKFLRQFQIQIVF